VVVEVFVLAVLAAPAFAWIDAACLVQLGAGMIVKVAPEAARTHAKAAVNIALIC
jgi:hypothetical protein